MLNVLTLVNAGNKTVEKYFDGGFSSLFFTFDT